MAQGLKSLLVNNLERLVKRRLKRDVSEKVPNLRQKLVALVASGIFLSILGRRGVLASETVTETDAAEEPEDEEFNLKDYLTRGCTRHHATVQEKAEIQQLIPPLAEKDFIEKLRDQYLPAMLKPFCDGWKSKISKNDYVNAWPVLQFYYDENAVEFTQLLSPQPSVSGRFIGVTTTILANVFCKFMKKTTLSKALLDSFPEALKKGKGAKVKPRHNVNEWIKHPDVLWRTVFPGAYRFCESHPNRKFLHFAHIDSARFLGLFAKTNCPNAAVGGFNSRSWRSTIDYVGNEKVSSPCMF